MKISIIIVTLNSAEYILTCLASIASQTYPDFDVIVQDGFSTDSTIDLVKSFKQKHPLLNLFIHQYRDTGVYDAMNLALDNTTGEWIYFLGSDDRLFSETTLESVSRNISSNIDVLYGDVVSSHFGGRYNGKFTPEQLFSQNICHQSLFLHRSVFKKHGKFNTNFLVAADWDHNIKWFLDSNIRVTYINVIIAIYGDFGFSSTTPDYCFDDEKPYTFINYGSKSVPFSLKLKIFTFALRSAFKKKKLTFIMRCVYLLPSVFKSTSFLKR